MRKTGLILLCLLIPVLLSAGLKHPSQQEPEPLSAQDALSCDSVFIICHSLSGDEVRVNYLHKFLWQNIARKWVIVLLDSALNLSIESKYAKGEIDIRHDYYRYYKFQADTAQMRKAFIDLRAACSKHDDYDTYFDVWADILQFRTMRGDTEFVKMEAERMGEEARALKNQRGIFNSKLTEARALKTSENNGEAIAKYRELLKLPHLSKIDMAMIHNDIALVYQMMTEYDKAIAELEMQRRLVHQAIRQNPEKYYIYKDKLLDAELSLCENYLAIAEPAKLKQHLDNAGKYYSPECLFSYQISYHVMWGGYYYLVDQWDDCFREFDTALSLFNGTQPMYEMSVRLMKGQALEYIKRYKEAAENYRQGAYEMDSLNRDILRLHEEAHQANYTIHQALLEKATAERQYNLLLSVLVVALIATLLTLLMRALYVRRALLRSERETREALETVKAANKMKEVFLRNITFQIRVPLNMVVGFSEVLSVEKGLSAEQMQEYAMLIKKNAERLSQMIFDILDLSRLESGMMKFTVENCDAVQMCRDVKMMVEMQDAAIRLQFVTELETLPLQADCARFRKMLSSVLSSSSTDKPGPVKVQYELTRDADNLKITIHGSPSLFSDEVEPESEPNHILHDINRLYLDVFGGSYQIVEADGEKRIVITYPIGKSNL